MKRVLWMSVVGVMGLSACGSAGANNVAACKSLAAKLSCGTAVNPLPASTCDSYQNTTCDISAYFTCMEGAYVCTNGTYDSTKLANASACASKAVCN